MKNASVAAVILQMAAAAPHAWLGARVACIGGAFGGGRVEPSPLGRRAKGSLARRTGSVLASLSQGRRAHSTRGEGSRFIPPKS